MKIGYARVSTGDQDLNSQVQLLEREGCEIIYRETVSGKRKDRPELMKMLSTLMGGDVVIVCKLDRLGRSLHHLLGIIETFKKNLVGFKSLGESMDTTTAQGMMLFGIFGVIAEFERSLISERTKSSLQYIKSQGRRLGPPMKDRSEDLAALAEVKNMPVAEALEELGWSRFKYYDVKKYAN